MIIIIFFILHWYLSLFIQTFFLHRYGAHKMFHMNEFWEKVFYLCVYIFQGSSFLTPRAYGIMHRKHHAFSDTEKDPHSPYYHNNLFSMMWVTRKKYNDLVDRKTDEEARFTNDLPEWKMLDNIGENTFSRIGWAVAYITFYVIFATQWWMFILLPIHFLMGAVHGAIVNWFGHKMGYVNYDNNDRSKNSLIIDFIMLGELFQNNHHKHSKRVKFSSKWFEMDPTYPVIKLFALMKIIRLTPKD